MIHLKNIFPRDIIGMKLNFISRKGELREAITKWQNFSIHSNMFLKIYGIGPLMHAFKLHLRTKRVTAI